MSNYKIGDIVWSERGIPPFSFKSRMGLIIDIDIVGNSYHLAPVIKYGKKSNKLEIVVTTEKSMYVVYLWNTGVANEDEMFGVIDHIDFKYTDEIDEKISCKWNSPEEYKKLIDDVDEITKTVVESF